MNELLIIHFDADQKIEGYSPFDEFFVNASG